MTDYGINEWMKDMCVCIVNRKTLYQNNKENITVLKPYK